MASSAFYHTGFIWAGPNVKKILSGTNILKMTAAILKKLLLALRCHGYRHSYPSLHPNSFQPSCLNQHEREAIVKLKKGLFFFHFDAL